MSDNIDIGSPASAYGYSWSYGTTLLDRTNPANLSGFVHTIEMYFYRTATVVKVGTFYGSAASWISRNYVSLGTVVQGSKQTFTGKYLLVEASDIAGTYYNNSGAAGNLHVNTSGGSGFVTKGGDQFGAGTQTYTVNEASGIVAMYLTGRDTDYAACYLKGRHRLDMEGVSTQNQIT